jgi:hypothetical protein
VSHALVGAPKEIRGAVRRRGVRWACGIIRPGDLPVATTDPAPAARLARFFDRLVRQTFADLRLGREGVGDYVTALLTRFACAEELYAIRDAAGRPLDSVTALLWEAERAWDFRAPDFDPFRERRVRQHVGDYALFMTGLFREHVERRAGAPYYVRQGRRAYEAVAAFERSALRPEARLFATLAAGFERYAAALTYMRRTYFRPGEAPAAAQPLLRLLAEW